MTTTQKIFRALSATAVAALILIFATGLAHAQDIQAPCGLTGGCEAGLQLSTLLDNRGISYSFVAIAGLIDGLNPCAVSLILILSGCVFLCIKDIKRIARVGAFYIGAIFSTYFLIGLFFSHAISEFMSWSWYPYVAEHVRWGLAGLLVFSALYNVVHFYLDRVDPDHTREGTTHFIHHIKKWSTHWPVAIVIGVTVTIFALPCSLPFYIGSIATLARTYTSAELVGYLVVYDLMFVAPLIVVLSLVMRSHKHFESVLHEKNRWLHLVMAAASVLLAVIYFYL